MTDFKDIKQAVSTQEKGVGFRPSFPALWHLEELGVVPDLSTFESLGWDAASQANNPVRVAIIDTPVAYKHPNLRGAIDLGLMRDFSVSDLGSFLLRNLAPASNEDRASRTDLVNQISAISGSNRSDQQNRILEEIADIASKSAISPGPQEVDPIDPFDRSPLPGAHGTALAGLIGARPTRINLVGPAYIDNSPEAPETRILELPYCGINPFCRIVPISISVSSRATSLLGALEYALMIEPDIVVVADVWERPGALESSAVELDDWQEVEQRFLALCRRCFVFCAAGNEARSTLEYPASLSLKSIAGGPWAVGAAQRSIADPAVATDLSYSPMFDPISMTHNMIRTLSTESSRYDREFKKVDPYMIRDEEIAVPDGVFDQDFPPRDIITTDIPGPFGYNPSPYRYTPDLYYVATDPPDPSEKHLEVASLFCRFAGTSASVAIAAGLTSLAMVKRRGGKPANWVPNFGPRDGLFDFELAQGFVGP